MIQACGRSKTDQDLRIFPLVMPCHISLGAASGDFPWPQVESPAEADGPSTV